MRRREFLGTVGAAAIAGPAKLAAGRSQESAQALYERAYAIDAMCFSAESPPQTYAQYLRPDKIEALRGSGITAMAMNMTSHYDASASLGLVELGHVRHFDEDVGVVGDNAVPRRDAVLHCLEQ